LADYASLIRPTGYGLGFFPFRLHAYKGRDVTHLMDDPIIGDATTAAAARAAGLPYLRGGIVEHGGSGHPIMEAMHLPPGEMHSSLMADSPTRDKMVAFTMQGEDLPQVTNRVDLDAGVRDVWGFPAGRVTYSPHAHDVACAHHWGPRLEQVMTESGATGTSWVTSPGTPGSRAPDLEPMSKHWMGTTRMGHDRATSVCDPWQRLWDVDNVVIADSSVFPTSTGYGPTMLVEPTGVFRSCADSVAVCSSSMWSSARRYSSGWSRTSLASRIASSDASDSAR